MLKVPKREIFGSDLFYAIKAVTGWKTYGLEPVNVSQHALKIQNKEYQLKH
jgi:hypothetical protein